MIIGETIREIFLCSESKIISNKEQGIKNIKQSTLWKFSFEYNDEEEWMIYETQPCTMTYQIFFNLVGLTE